jgi:hypothetical protein
VDKQHNEDEQHFELAGGAADVVVAGDDDGNTRHTFVVEEVGEAAHPIAGKVDSLEEEVCDGHEKVEVGRVEAPEVAAVVEVLEVVEERIAAGEEVDVDVEELD